jgi:hypothetical protein
MTFKPSTSKNPSLLDGRLGALCLVLTIAGSTFAVQDAPATPPEPVTDPPVADAPDAPDAPPSLDDLLEIEGEADSGAAETAAESERQRSLDKALAEQKPEQAFQAAVTEMLQSVDRLREEQATGLGTQRLQERIVDRLQVMIDSAKKQQQQQQQQQQSSSSSSQQQDPGRRSEGEPEQQESQGSQRNEGEAQDGTSNQPPSPESADLEGVLDESRIEWGGLPPRVRDLITQGMRDQVSQLYRSLTEAYYRRMAEEASE